MVTSAHRTGNPLKLLELMWAPSTRVGRTGATVGGIVDSAVELADTAGLEALTMRGLAARVGVGAMTLYGYVPGKPELIELMLDRVAQTTYAGCALPAEQATWRDCVRYVAERNFEHALAHGWTVEVSPARPILGPGVCTKYERELAALDGRGLTDHEMDHALTTVVGMAAGAARWQLGLDRVRAQSRLTDEQWWRLAQPVLASTLSETDLPVSSRVGRSVASAGEPRASLVSGLELLLDGLALRIT